MTVNPHSIDLSAFVSEHLQRAEPDLLRSMLTAFIQALMGAEADAVCGASYGTRSPDRANSRNGYRTREFDTRAGTMEVAIPKLREGSYVPEWLLERRKRAERDKRAAILHAEGERQAKILTAEGTRQQEILVAQGDQQAAILRADGEARAVDLVFQAVHRNNADPKVLAYKYLETLPHLAKSGNTFWVIPGEVTQAIRTITEAFGDNSRMGAPPTDKDRADSPPSKIQDEEGSRALTSGGPPSLDAVAAADRVTELAESAVNEAKAEAAAAQRGIESR